MLGYVVDGTLPHSTGIETSPHSGVVKLQELQKWEFLKFVNKNSNTILCYGWCVGDVFGSRVGHQVQDTYSKTLFLKIFHILGNHLLVCPRLIKESFPLANEHSIKNHRSIFHLVAIKGTAFG